MPMYTEEFNTCVDGIERTLHVTPTENRSKAQLSLDVYGTEDHGIRLDKWQVKSLIEILQGYVDEWESKKR